MQQDVHAALVCPPAKCLELRFENLPPHLRRNHQAILRPPVFREHDSIGAGIGEAVDCLEQLHAHKGVEAEDVVAFQYDVAEIVLQAAEFAGDIEGKSGQAADAKPLALSRKDSGGIG